MAFLSKVKSAAGSLKKKAGAAMLGAKLEKACFVTYKDKACRNVDKRAQVQFNPSEYSIRRGMKLSDKKPLGRDAGASELQAMHGEHSSLSVSLYFDSYTELAAGQGIVNEKLGKATDFLGSSYNKYKPHKLPSADMGKETSPDSDYAVNQRFQEFLELIRYAPEEHQPPKVGFVWGEYLHFVGMVASYDVQYTLFDRAGTPVRAKLSLEMVGEERELMLKSGENPFESPDRTKQRTLRYGDQLWMLAQEEYGDPAHWKTIAEANGILNPRVTGGAMRLKVPSIR